MTQPLWTAADIATATGAQILGVWSVNGVSIDSRTVAEGELFVALVGENNDAHEYIDQALARKAGALLLSRLPANLPAGAPVALVKDTMVALEALGQFARKRCKAKFAAVTGSVGKTSTKEALTQLLAKQALTYGSKGNLNNNFGVPLSLARLPVKSTYGVFELGMNHPGEIAPLSQQVAPSVVIVTTIAPAHVEYFDDGVEGIAREKASIAAGLTPGGTAILTRDTPYYEVLYEAAKAAGAARIFSFGTDVAADVRLTAYVPDADGAEVSINFFGRWFTYRIGAQGKHQAINSLGVLAAIDAIGGNVEQAMEDYAEIGAPAGRGQRSVLAWGKGEIVLFDESYNASPVAVRAALGVLGQQPGRRIVVLGDMLELGAGGPEMHMGLLDAVNAAGLHKVFACGPLMKPLYDALPEASKGLWAPTSEALKSALLALIAPGDVVTIKGSLGMRMGPLVAAVREASSAKGSAS
ncbi:UDP-N-acetylmuramoyl-tripeptide--D-alanyl-D-alanine ligase [Lacibacterium aquatile]|uniref:UDP-N-acetylmuramoyl-tripeptide--D-alanyl-D-alanine ligase n=1 Tax=Lacibacterium aquatile TaxID=1168082 RepID=A0ABW5DUD6_9PROT